jgi:uncharacterized short protein YbdD (DUF466 family)
MPVNLLSDLARGWTSVCYWLREFTGENAYPRYVAEWRARHPGLDPEAPGEHRLLSAREFFDRQLQLKYGAAVQRC